MRPIIGTNKKARQKEGKKEGKAMDSSKHCYDTETKQFVTLQTFWDHLMAQSNQIHRARRLGRIAVCLSLAALAAVVILAVLLL